MKWPICPHTDVKQSSTMACQAPGKAANAGGVAVSAEMTKMP
jgi:glutamate dehydrogenase/leucine dehydrogenase